MELSFDTQRRNFLATSAKTGVCIACCGLISTIISACDTVDDGEPVINLGDYPELQRPGGAIKKRYSRLNNSEPILIIRRSESQFVAYSALCTHKGVEVKLPKDGEIVCPNHGSRFRTKDGTVIEGKAIEPLQQISATYDAAKNILRIG
ncbi:MAG: Rieske (2Fe-2S) protein [Ignavibacteriales bacterium]|nr:Rieske (2Fe-2S) protein [Ignavibacteriales bacterium]